MLSLVFPATVVNFHINRDKINKYKQRQDKQRQNKQRQNVMCYVCEIYGIMGEGELQRAGLLLTSGGIIK